MALLQLLLRRINNLQVVLGQNGGKIPPIARSCVKDGLREAAASKDKAGHTHACRILEREHFKRLYEWNPKDVKINPESGIAVLNALSEKYDRDQFRHDRYSQGSGAPNFPIQMRDGRIVSCLAISEVLRTLPVVSVDCVFADRSIFDNAIKWLIDNRNNIIEPEREEAGNG